MTCRRRVQNRRPESEHTPDKLRLAEKKLHQTRQLRQAPKLRPQVGQARIRQTAAPTVARLVDPEDPLRVAGQQVRCVHMRVAPAETNTGFRMCSVSLLAWLVSQAQENPAQGGPKDLAQEDLARPDPETRLPLCSTPATSWSIATCRCLCFAHSSVVSQAQACLHAHA